VAGNKVESIFALKFLSSGVPKTIAEIERIGTITASAAAKITPGGKEQSEKLKAFVTATKTAHAETVASERDRDEKLAQIEANSKKRMEKRHGDTLFYTKAEKQLKADLIAKVREKRNAERGAWKDYRKELVSTMEHNQKIQSFVKIATRETQVRDPGYKRLQTLNQLATAEKASIKRRKEYSRLLFAESNAEKRLALIKKETTAKIKTGELSPASAYRATKNIAIREKELLAIKKKRAIAERSLASETKKQKVIEARYLADKKNIIRLEKLHGNSQIVLKEKIKLVNRAHKEGRISTVQASLEISKLNNQQKEAIAVTKRVADNRKRVEQATKQYLSISRSHRGEMNAIIALEKTQGITKKTLEKRIKLVTRALKDKRITEKAARVQIEKYNIALKKVAANERRAAGAKSIKRLIQWAAMWTSTYAIIRRVVDGIKAVAVANIEFEDELGRVNTVMRSNILTNEHAIDIFKNRLTYAVGESAASVKELTSVLYHLQSAGLAAEESMAAFKHIVTLTNATTGDMQQIARLAASAFIVFNKNIKYATSHGEKFQRIADVLAHTYRNQQVELSEIAAGIQYVGSVASIMNINFDTLVGTLGFLNTSLLRGSKAGTSLLNAFAQLASKAKILQKEFYVTFDPSKPLDFTSIMGQLHQTIGDSGISTAKFGKLMQIFGRRGARAVLLILRNYKKWLEAIDMSQSKVRGVAKQMSLIRLDTLGKQAKIFGNNLKMAMMGNLTGILSVKKLIKDVNDEMKERHIVKAMADTWGIQKDIQKAHKTGLKLVKEEGLAYIQYAQNRANAHKELSHKTGELTEGYFKNAMAMLALFTETYSKASFSVLKNQERTAKALSGQGVFMEEILVLHNLISNGDKRRVDAQFKILEGYALQEPAIKQALDVTKLISEEHFKLLKTQKKEYIETLEIGNATSKIFEKLVGDNSKLVVGFQQKNKLRQAELSIYSKIEQLTEKESHAIRLLNIQLGKMVNVSVGQLSDEKEALSVLKQQIKERAKGGRISKADADAIEEKNDKIKESVIALEKLNELHKKIKGATIEELYALSQNNDEFIKLIYLAQQAGVVVEDKLLPAFEKMAEKQHEIAEAIKSSADSMVDNFSSAFIEATRNTKEFGRTMGEVAATIGDDFFLAFTKKFTEEYLYEAMFKPLAAAQQAMLTGAATTKDLTGAASIESGTAGFMKSLAAGATKLEIDAAIESDLAMIDSGKIAAESFGKETKKQFMSQDMANTFLFLGTALAAPIIRGLGSSASVSGAQQGSMLGGMIGSIFSPLGTIIGGTLGGIAGGIFGKKHSTQPMQEEIKDSIEAGTNNLVFTNEKLTLINRNMIGLRQDLKPYIMPSSYYFRGAGGKAPVINVDASGMSVEDASVAIANGLSLSNISNGG